MASGITPRIVAVVPLYRPDARQIADLGVLAGQVDHVVAVDDGSGDWPGLVDVDPAGTTLLRLADNGGIARALNRGVQHARALGATHVLTIDQDSRLVAGYVAHAVRALRTAEEQSVPVGGIGAGRIGPHRLGGAAVTDDLRNGSQGIQSGWLIPVTVLDEVGGFDESLFIDCVDVDFLMRLEAAGRPMLVSDGCAIEHALGTDERVLHLFGRRAVFSIHPPFRRYYITRNRLIMLRRYGRQQPGPMVGQTVLAARIAAMGLVFGDRRRAQATAVVAGLVDGVRSSGGRIPARTERALRRAGA